MSHEAHQGSTVADLIITAIERFPDRIAFRNDEATVSYRALGEKISQIAQYFDSIGLQPGDTVAQLAVNRFEVFAIIAAVYMRGLRSVTLHAMGSEADHEYVLDDCGASVLIVDAYHEARGMALRERCGKVRTWLSLGEIPGFDDLGDAINDYQPAPLIAYGDSEVIVRLAYTGGTTGRPKGVMLSNRALATNVVIDLAVKEWPEEIKYLCVAPISHGAGSLVVPTLMRGGCVTLMRSFSAGGVIDTINRYGCNVTWLVPTMLYALLDSERVYEVDWSKFHSLIYSAAPTSPSRIRQALNLLGPILIQSYGQTESPNSILIMGKQDHSGLSDAQLASAGRPSPLMRVCLLDAEGVEVPAGERGEVCVRGPLLMSGYLNNPTETASALKGGWLHTGDIAYKDVDGLYYIVDRKKDMIISGGFNVYPKEIEDAICAHPSVASAAVIGVPDEKWGELVMAYVQLKDGCQLSEEEIAATVREAKGAVATPKRVQFIDALPLTALGKIDKKALRSLHWNAGQRSVH
ncbi:acyl-CoA synthetase [Cupriavidus sp. TA19]|uniref:AMP-binding protein n=1 Tax=unclassified Cupriavidus TaxID=2640874 RepID=UPI00272944ED|nr:AMP-binding protein [Cupriavidus sp. TA19]GLC97131.1 acyl-CoA synthetase [Cupriavidus sp. TA19]